MEPTQLIPSSLSFVYAGMSRDWLPVGKAENIDRPAWREAYPLEKPLIVEVGVLNNSAGCIHESIIFGVFIVGIWLGFLRIHNFGVFIVGIWLAVLAIYQFIYYLGL
jgi:hypothetical protein